jgi:hypothetical protein
MHLLVFTYILKDSSLSTQCVYVFPTILTNSDYFPTEHYVIGLFSANTQCSLHGT